MKVRLAKSVEDLSVAQSLRYQVFHEELGASGNITPGLDADEYDKVAQHLLVIDENASRSALSLPDGQLVGTYRLLEQKQAPQVGGFYSAREFALEPLLQRKVSLKFLELGRSCVLKSHRGSVVIELLWQGIWNFVRQNKIDVMIGCASFEGTDPHKHSISLSYLAQKHKAPDDWRVQALPQNRCHMDLVAPETYDGLKAALALPPLIRGYLRLGCYFGDGAVIDKAFNTIDVLVVLPVASINARYFARFGSPA